MDEKHSSGRPLGSLLLSTEAGVSGRRLQSLPGRQTAATWDRHVLALSRGFDTLLAYEDHRHSLKAVAAEEAAARLGEGSVTSYAERRARGRRPVPLSSALTAFASSPAIAASSSYARATSSMSWPAAIVLTRVVAWSKR